MSSSDWPGHLPRTPDVIRREIRRIRIASKVYLIGTVLLAAYAAFGIVVVILSPSVGSIIVLVIATVLAFLLAMAWWKTRPHLVRILAALHAELDAVGGEQQSGSDGGGPA